jgi:C1A family cysteine protease
MTFLELKMDKVILSLSLLLATTSAFSQQPSMGDETSAEDFKNILKTADRATRDFDNLPVTYSLKQYAPPVKDQGELGTCVAWSSAYAARTISYAINKNFNNKDSIIKYTFSPGHLYNRIKKPNDTECKLGVSILTAMQKLKERGNGLLSEGITDCTVSMPDERNGSLR